MNVLALKSKKEIENYSEVSRANPQDDIPITNFDIDFLS